MQNHNIFNSSAIPRNNPSNLFQNVNRFPTNFPNNNNQFKNFPQSQQNFAFTRPQYQQIPQQQAWKPNNNFPINKHPYFTPRFNQTPNTQFGNNQNNFNRSNKPEPMDVSSGNTIQMSHQIPKKISHTQNYITLKKVILKTCQIQVLLISMIMQQKIIHAIHILMQM